MKPPPFRTALLRSAGGLVALFSLFAFRAAAWGDGSNGVVAVSARVSKDYVRRRLPDGTFQVETYAFGKGGCFHAAAHAQVPDLAVETMPFSAIAITLAGALKRQNYLPSTDPTKRRLLILVYWGLSMPPDNGRDSPTFVNMQAALSNPTMTDEARDNAITAYVMDKNQAERVDARNASMLGFDSWWSETSPIQRHEFLL
jgi:hypothetical protein